MRRKGEQNYKRIQRDGRLTHNITHVRSRTTIVAANICSQPIALPTCEKKTESLGD